MTGEERLLEQLRRFGRVRVERVPILEAFQAAFPAEAIRPEARAMLAGMLEALRDAGHLELPRQRRGWDHSVRPPLPEWVVVRLEAAPRAQRPDHRGVPWAPELAFVAELDRVDALDALLAIQRFLAEGGRSRPLVPLRERSVDLFGDEKRLEKLARTTLFGPGRLSLQVLRCFPVAPPLVWAPGPGCAGRSPVPDRAGGASAQDRAGGAPAQDRGDRAPAPDPACRPVLILENHHTYHSFCRWNAREGVYAAVVYGGGNAFVSSVEYLAEVLTATGGDALHYFGDLDPEGLAIVQRARERLRSALELTRPLPDIAPAVEWYRLLLERGGVEAHGGLFPFEMSRSDGRDASPLGGEGAGERSLQGDTQGPCSTASSGRGAGGGDSRLRKRAEAEVWLAPMAKQKGMQAGSGSEGGQGDGPVTGPDERAIQWLPEDLRAPVRALFGSGRRLAQELVGWEVLEKL